MKQCDAFTREGSFLARREERIRVCRQVSILDVVPRGGALVHQLRILLRVVPRRHVTSGLRPRTIDLDDPRQERACLRVLHARNRGDERLVLRFPPFYPL